MKQLVIAFLIFTSNQVVAQTNLITWKELDTPGLGIYKPTPKIKRIQVGDLVDHFIMTPWFTDSFNKAQRDHKVLYPNGNQEILDVQLEASTVLRKKTFHDLIFIELDETLEKGDTYLFSMSLIFYHGSYNSNRLFVSFLSDSTLEAFVRRDFKKPANEAIWFRHDSTMFPMDEYEEHRFVYKANGGEKYVLIGSPKVNKVITKEMRIKKSFDYWGYQINALRLAFSQISVYKVNQVDSLEFNYEIGESMIDDFKPIQKYSQPARVDSIAIIGYADTVGLNDSMNLALALRRAQNLRDVYKKAYPDFKFSLRQPQVLTGAENRKAKLLIHRTLVLDSSI